MTSMKRWNKNLNDNYDWYSSLIRSIHCSAASAVTDAEMHSSVTFAHKFAADIAHHTVVASEAESITTAIPLPKIFISNSIPLHNLSISYTIPPFRHFVMLFFYCIQHIIWNNFIFIPSPLVPTLLVRKWGKNNALMSKHFMRMLFGYED